MSGVKRYDYGYTDDGLGGARYLGLIEKPDGKLVRASDHDRLEQERERFDRLHMAAEDHNAYLRAELDELRGQVAAMQVDAERYRWMRASFVRNHNHSFTWYLSMFEPLTAEGLDSNVDSARKAKP